MLTKCDHLEDPMQFRIDYIKNIESIMQNEIIIPIARAIEGDLRLHISSLNDPDINKLNPFDSENFSRWLQCEPIYFDKWVFNIKKKVEDYLDETFYNMTALNLNDWTFYE